MKLINKGYTAEVYDYGDNKICKLFNENFPDFAVKYELNNAKIIQKTSIKVPRVYNIIEMNNRTGIIYEKIKGVTISDKIDICKNIEYWMVRITKLHKNIFNYHTNEGISFKEFLRIILGDRNKENDYIFEQIDKLPDGDCLCHGDFHFSNIMVNDKDELFLIDFMNICYGPWQYDVARTYVLLEGFKRFGKVQELYLSNMNVKYSDIKDFVLIIKECRKFELQY